MNSQMIAGKSIHFDSPTQIINMGGPWVAKLVIDQKVIANNVLIDNLYPNPTEEKLYFVRYHEVSKWESNNFFYVYFIEVASGEMYMYDLKFVQIFIDGISNGNILAYFDAFHNKNPVLKRTIDLSSVECTQIKR